MNKRLNYLLVMPRFVSRIGEGYHFQMGIAYISAVLKHENFNVFTLNLNHHEGNVAALVQAAINENNIDVVMAGCLSFQYVAMKEIIDAAKELQKFVVLGGGIITGDPVAAMEAFGNADIGVIGEGEASIVDLCQTLEAGGDFSAVNGIIYRDAKEEGRGGDYTITAPRKEIANLDSLPYPDHDGFELRRYLELPPSPVYVVLEKATFFMIGSRSCPYQCTFCFHTSGKKYRQRSVENILDEIQHLKERYGVQAIVFFDELFARKADRVKIIAERLKEWSIAWAASFRVDDITEEMIDIVKNSTCYVLGLGIESADNTVLASMKKKTTVEKIENALRLCYNAGVAFAGNLIFGDINETLQTATNSLDFHQAHPEYNLAIDFITTFPGSYLYRYALKEGIIKDAVQFLRDGCPTINVSKMTDDEISKVAKRMLYLTVQNRQYLQSVHVKNISKTSGSFVSGICTNCGSEVARTLKLFQNNSYLICKKCGNKFYVEIPENQMTAISRNIKILLKNHTKIALWGITQYTLPIFDQNNFYGAENILFIDNSAMKQKILIHGKQVQPPSILGKGDIGAVVFCYPSIGQFKIIVENEFPGVTQFISLLDLLDYDEK